MSSCEPPRTSGQGDHGSKQHRSEEEARKRLKRTDENWTAYIKQVYGHDRNLAAHYDLVLDTGRLATRARLQRSSPL